MTKYLLAFILLFAATGQAQVKMTVPCTQGGKALALRSVMQTPGVNVPTNIVGSYPKATYTVYVTGSSPYTQATLYDISGNPAPNPGTCDSNGLAQFWIGPTTIDVTFSGTGITTPFTLGGIQVFAAPIVALCGSIDDTIEVQAAFNLAVASSSVLTIPPATCTVKNLNFTGHDHWRIEGSTEGTSEILCVSSVANTGTCIDESGDEHTQYSNLWIQGGTSAADAPRILVLSGKTTTSNGSWHTFDHVTVSTFGSFGLFNYGAESTDYDAMTWSKPGYIGTAHLADLVLSTANSATLTPPSGVTSAFTTLATPPVSMTTINLGQANNSVTLAYGSWIVFDDDIFGATMGQITSKQSYTNSCSSHAAAISETSSAFSTNGLVIFGLDFENAFQEHCDASIEANEYPFLSVPQSIVQYSKFDLATNTRTGHFPSSVLNAFDWGMSTFSIDTFGMMPPTIVGCANTMEGYGGLASAGNTMLGVGFGGQNATMYCAGNTGFTPVGATTLHVGEPPYAGANSARNACIGSGPGSGGTFTYGYFGTDVCWNDTTWRWESQTDSVSNGGAMIGGSSGGTLNIYAVPSTGNTNQSLTDAQMQTHSVAAVTPSGWTSLTSNFPTYATNELALAAGMTTGQVYQTGANPSVLAAVTGSAPVAGSAPLAPTGLSAVAGVTQVVLTWNASLGATLYTPCWSTTSGGPYTCLSPSIPGLTYTKTGLTNGTPYYFVVQAANGIGPSPNSVEVTATPTATPSTIYRPTTATDTGTYVTTSPAQAYDGNLATFASVTGLVYYGNWSGDCTFAGFTNTAGPWTSAVLTIYSKEYQDTTSPSTAVLRYSLDSGSTWTNLHSTTSTWDKSVTPDTVTLGGSQNLSHVKVEAIQPYPAAAYSDSIFVYEIYISAY